MKNRKVLSLAGGGGPAEQAIITPYLSSRTCFGIYQTTLVERNAGQMLKRVQHDKKGFTMAEILLSLTIIGVVAAITLPSLTGNINERTWNTQRKALYARFSQALPLMDSLNGFGTVSEDESGSITVDTAAETFVTAGLSKVMKINNICDSNHLPDCGIVSKITTIGGVNFDVPKDMATLNPYMTSSASDGYGNSTSMLNTKAAAFETANGESILVYYNPRCVGSLKESPWGGSSGIYVQNKVCANFIYDLNGNKGPNTVGKDIGFMTVMYPSDVKLAAPIPANKYLAGTYEFNAAIKACSNYDSEYRVPNVDEDIAMFVNHNLLQGNSITMVGKRFWSTEKISSGGQIRGIMMSLGAFPGQIDDKRLDDNSLNVWCVKR